MQRLLAPLFLIAIFLLPADAAERWKVLPQTPPPVSDDPLSPPAALQLPAPEPSPYAEMQPDRRVLLARMAALFRLARGFAPPVLVASAAVAAAI